MERRWWLVIVLVVTATMLPWPVVPSNATEPPLEYLTGLELWVVNQKPKHSFAGPLVNIKDQNGKWVYKKKDLKPFDVFLKFSPYWDFRPSVWDDLKQLEAEEKGWV